MFPYLGRFDLDWNRISDYCNSIPYDKWDSKCSTTKHFAKNPHRVGLEKNIPLYYHEQNASCKELREVADQNFLPDSWFDTLKVTKQQHNVKINWTKPGNFEPPHVDFFPSFLTEYKEDSTKWSLEEITKLGKGILRAWIPLTDSKLGHMLYTNDYALTSWKVGDVYELPSGVPHGFANGGLEDRLLMVFTAWRC